MRQRTKHQRRKSQKKNKQEFTSRTRVYDLLKREFHDELKKLIEDIRPFIRDGDSIDWKHLRYIDFDERKIPKTEFVLIIVHFILAIGKGDGLKCKMSVFVRYIASNEHSNLGLKYSSLNTLIYRMFAYLESYEKMHKIL